MNPGASHWFEAFSLQQAGGWKKIRVEFYLSPIITNINWWGLVETFFQENLGWFCYRHRKTQEVSTLAPNSRIFVNAFDDPNTWMCYSRSRWTKYLEKMTTVSTYGGHLHLGKWADNGIPKIRNVIKTIIILAQNILHLSVYKL